MQRRNRVEKNGFVGRSEKPNQGRDSPALEDRKQSLSMRAEIAKSPNGTTRQFVVENVVVVVVVVVIHSPDESRDDVGRVDDRVTRRLLLGQLVNHGNSLSWGI